MSSFHYPFTILSSIFFFYIFLIQSHSTLSTQLPKTNSPNNDNTNATTPIPASTLCQSTQYPSYCKSILQSDNKTANVYEYGRFSFKRSISQSSKFLKLINKYLHNSKKLKLTPYAIAALQDCKFLSELNLDFLTTSYMTVNNNPNKTLTYLTAEDIHTYLSSVLTNQQTCLDGIEAIKSSWSFDHGITSPLSNDTKLYSISLFLYTKAWIPKKGFYKSKHKSHSHHTHKFKMSDRVQGVLRNERFLQSVNGGDDDDDDEVQINDVVTVSLDGSGNFTSINEAVMAAPNKTEAEDGYFLIYVTAGVYEEYVNIDKKKRYIMMMGDGINQTIITGNRSVVDNFTTFQSATFGKLYNYFVLITFCPSYSFRLSHLLFHTC